MNIQTLRLITARIDAQPHMDAAGAATVYAALRADLLATGVPESDLPQLTEHLIASMEAAGQWMTADVRAAHLELIARHFLGRAFHAHRSPAGVITVTLT